jgi:hypothetical protein
MHLDGLSAEYYRANVSEGNPVSKEETSNAIRHNIPFHMMTLLDKLEAEAQQDGEIYRSRYAREILDAALALFNAIRAEHDLPPMILKEVK